MIRLVMIAVAVLTASVTPPTSADEAKREWTFIYVMSYDNNLEGCADIINRGLQTRPTGGVRAKFNTMPMYSSACPR